MPESNDTIHFVMTGGTIDSEYNGAFDTVEPRDRSVVPQYMRRVNPERTTEFTQACMKDSRRLNDDDRRTVADIIEASDTTKFIVTHGTYTLPESAQFLEKHLDVSNKVVILTGSTIPLEGITMSNGGFNLGFAFALVDVLPPGIHVCVAGRVYTPTELMRLLNEGRFTTIFSALPER